MELWNIQHPWFRDSFNDWVKYRLTYEGGRRFIDTYLKTFSKREEADDFTTRKCLTYCPAFAEAAIEDIKNSIYQRMTEITRLGVSKDYLEAILGENGGVDLEGSTMNNFVGQEVLPELLTMGKVGVYVDMPQLTGSTLAETMGEHPYLYIYTAEQIPSWNCVRYQGEKILTNLVLNEIVMQTDKETGLIYGKEMQIRQLVLTGDGVQVSVYKKYTPEPNEINPPPYKQTTSVLLRGMKRIPFHVAELNHSLLKNVADYQIALLNMESADISYIIRSNFPFYVEPYDPRSTSGFLTPSPAGDSVASTESTTTIAEAAKSMEIKAGAVSGRRYPHGVGPPEFIHPSPEPLMVSMKKEEQIKNDIRSLVNIALSTVKPVFASAESKGMDDRSLEAGLSYIGLELEHLERNIASSWSYYMKGDKATVKYPRKYSLKSDKERREEAKDFLDLTAKIPSETCQKAVAMEVATILLEQKVDQATLDKIRSEVKKANFLTSDYQAIASDISLGLVSKETASNARGYDGKTEIPVAEKEHAARLAEIQKAQTSSATGVNDTTIQPDASKAQKIDPSTGGPKPQRGSGR